MTRITTERGELEVTMTGEGESVLMIHGGVLVDTFDALGAERALADNFKLISYHRHGYGRSSRAKGPYGIADGVSDAVDVLREAGAEGAHVRWPLAGRLDSPATLPSTTRKRCSH